MTWLGMGLRMGGNTAATSGSPPPTGATWNGSTDTPASSADWVRSGSNLIATRSSGSGDALLRASAPLLASKSFKFTMNAEGTSADLLMGLVPAAAATTDWIGGGAGLYIASNSNQGNSVSGGSLTTAGIGNMSTGDTLEFFRSADGTQITVKYNGSSVPNYFGVPSGAVLYPAVSTANTGSQVTLDPTGLA